MLGRAGKDLPVGEMKKLLDQLKKRPEDGKLLSDCITLFLNHFIGVDDAVFAKLAMKKQMGFFVMFLIQKVVQSGDVDSCMELMFCLNKASVFIPDTPDLAVDASRLLVATIFAKTESALLVCGNLWRNMLTNKHIVNEVLSEVRLVSIYSGALQKSVDAGSVVFEFLRGAVRKKGHVQADETGLFSTTFISSLPSACEPAICFGAALFRNMERSSELERNFDEINNAVVRLESALCYNDLLYVPTSEKNLALTKFGDLYNFTSFSAKLYETMISVAASNPNLVLPVEGGFHVLQDVSVEFQGQLLSLIWNRHNDLKSSLIGKLFPPWIFHIDCRLLANFAKDHLDEEWALVCLSLTLDSRVDQLKEAFDTMDGFEDMILAFFRRVDNFVHLADQFRLLVNVMAEGSYGAVNCFERLCDDFPAALFTKLLISNIDRLGHNSRWCERLPHMMREVDLLAHELLTPEVVQWCVNEKMFDCLAALAADGPHYEIDAAIVGNEDKFSDLPERQLQNLVQGRMLDSEQSNTEMIRIPSLTPLLPVIVGNTLFDLSVVAKYMIDNKIVRLEDDSFACYGVQYLTPQLAVMAMDKPSVLLKLTNPEYPHQTVHQFQKGRANAFVILPLPVDLEVNVNDKHRVKMFSIDGASDFNIIYQNEALSVGKETIPFARGSWHRMRIVLKDNSVRLYLHNGREPVYVCACWNKEAVLTIGSPSETPQSTFYVRSHDGRAFPVLQTGSGSLIAEYRGIVFHLPFINGDAQIFRKLLACDNGGDFRDYVMSLVNIHRMRPVSDRKRILGMLRCVICQKADLLTQPVFDHVFSLAIVDNSVNLELLRELFLDYELWAKCTEDLARHLLRILETWLTHDELFKFFRLFADLHCQFHMECSPITSKIREIFKPTPGVILNLFDGDADHGDSLLDSSMDFAQLIRFIEMFSISDGLRILEEYSKQCLVDDAAFNGNALIRAIPFLSRVICNEKMWKCLLMLATRRDLEDYQDLPIERPVMLKIIFQLLGYLCMNRHTEMCDSLVNLLETLSYDFTGMEYELQLLLRVGFSSENSTVLPLCCCEFGPNRPLCPGRTYCPTSTDDNIGIELGMLNDDGILSDEAAKQLSIELRKSLIVDKVEITRQPFTVEDIFNSRVFAFARSRVLSLQRPTLASFEKLFTFGADLDVATSIELHRHLVLDYMRNAGISAELLGYLCDVVTAGWWDGAIKDLCTELCCAVRKFSGEETNDFSKRLSVLFRLILALDQIDISELSDVFMRKSLLAIYGYPQFLYHICLRTPGNEVIAGAVRSGSFADEDGKTLGPKCESVFNEFMDETTAKLGEINKKFHAIRLSLVNDMNIDLRLPAFMKRRRIFSILRQKIFNARYNMTSLRNERQAYSLWNLTKECHTDRFQIPPSVHPLSAPTLYVPFFSNVDYRNFKEYGRYVDKTNDVGAEFAHIPHCVDSYISQPFLPISSEFYPALFSKLFGNFESYTSMYMLAGSELIPCVLAKCDGEFLILTEARALDKQNFVFTKHNEKLIVATFLDECCAGYFGESFLFCGHVVIKFALKHITISTPQLYLSNQTAVEIWLAAGYSLFLIFDTVQDATEYEAILRSQSILPYSKSIFSLSFASKLTIIARKQATMKSIATFQQQWVNNELSTFAYLLILNFFGGRSFSNVSQYPVMPWARPERDLGKPMGQQTEERAQAFCEKYEGSAPDYHFYGSLYSSPAIVYHFLLRIEPFTCFHIDLQVGFDHADRLFYAMEEEWETASRLSTHNVEELIPEVFLLPEMFTDTNRCPIPVKNNGTDICNCLLSPTHKNWVSYVIHLRRQLDDAIGIEKWLDLIFGVNSRGEKAIEHKNLFYPTTYNIKSALLDDSEEVFLDMKKSFGQVPTQLFMEPHPAKNTVIHARSRQLVDTDSITNQRIRIDIPMSAKELLTVESKGGFALEDVRLAFGKHISSTIKEIPVQGRGWHRVSDLVTASFSCDHHLFAAVFECGAMIIFRALCSSKKDITGYEALSFATLPSKWLSEVAGESATCCAVSSHLFIAVEAIKNRLFCFHVPTSMFIRCLELRGAPQHVMINDTFQIIFAVGPNFIEVHTINGTLVAYSEVDDPIRTSSISLNDVSVFLATGHASGKVVLWTLDLEEQVLVQKIIVSIGSPVEYVDVISEGSAVIAVGEAEHGEGTIFCARGLGKKLFDAKFAIGCAQCKRHEQLSLCNSCGLYFCKKCSKQSGTTLCLQCLNHVEEIAGVLDFPEDL